MFLAILNTILFNFSNNPFLLELKICSIQTVVITSFVVISEVSIKKVDCTINSFEYFSGETQGKIISRRQGESYYGNNYECSWRIDAGENKKIKLTVLSTNLQWAPTYTTCSSYDNLQIFDGKDQSCSRRVLLEFTNLCIVSLSKHLDKQADQYQMPKTALIAVNQGIS